MISGDISFFATKYKYGDHFYFIHVTDLVYINYQYKDKDKDKDKTNINININIHTSIST